MNAWPSHDTSLNPPPSSFDSQTLDPSQMFATQPNGNLPYQNPQFPHQPLQQQHPSQLQQQHHQQQLQNPRAQTPQQSFPYQVNPVVPSKRPRPGDDGIAASPRQHPNAPNLSRSQTPQQTGYPQNPQSGQGPGGHQQQPQSAAPGSLQAPNPYQHLQHAGSANATPSPTMSNQQYRPPQPQSRMQTLSPNPTFPSQTQQQQQQTIGMSPTPDPAARVNTPQTAQFPNNGQQMGAQMGGQMQGQMGGMNFGMQNPGTSQFNPNFGANPNANPAANGQFPMQVTLPPNLAAAQAEANRLHQMKQQQQMMQQQLIAQNMTMAQAQARQAQANAMNPMMNPMAPNPNMAMANRPPGQPGMNPAQQQHQQQFATANRSFIPRLQMFLQQRNIPLDPNPMVAGRPILLYQLFQLIQRAGGSRQVTMRTQWAQVAQALGYPAQQFPTAAAEVKDLFERTLALWESAVWQNNAQQKAKMDAMQQNQNAAMQNPQMSPTRTMPQTPQSQAQQHYLQQLQQQRMSQTPQSQGAPSTPSQANAQLPTANGWATPQNAMDMKQANQFAQHRKSMSRQADGSPAPMPPAGFPVASPALTNKMIDPADEQKPINGIDPNVPEESDMDPTNYVPRSSVLTNQWGGIDPDLMGQLGFHIAAFKPNVPDIDEMGIIDIRALSLSLQSGIHGEVRYALDVLARLTCHPAVNIDLHQCEDLLDILLDCAEEQMDLLAEEADEVSDTVDPKSYEETTRQIKLELEGLQPVPDVGSSDWNLDRTADKLLACTSILRNLSFMAKNTQDLAREPTIKFVSMLARLLGTREVLLRSYVNTQDCMKDLVTLLSNVADQVELPSRDDANNILHFLLAFAPEGPTAGSPSTKNALRFPLYNPRSQRYYPLALDTLAKLLARDEPNRTYLKEIMLDQSATQADSTQSVLQKFDILTRVFGFAIAVLPDRHAISTGRMPNTNDLIMRVAEARLASLAQGMLAADILASLIPASETTLARLWLESEDGWAVSLFWLITFMCHRRQQHETEVAGAGRRGSTTLMPSRTGRPSVPEEPLNLMGAVNQRAAALLKKLGCKVAEGFGIAAATDDAAVKPVSHASEERFDVDVIPLSLDEEISTSSALDIRGSGTPVINGISEDATAASNVNGARESELVTNSLDDDYERAKFWSGVAGEILPRAETLFGAFATPTLDLALLRDFVDLADLV